MGAATRYLSQRYTAPWGQVKAGLTDIGTEELAHIEIVSAILYQLTKGLTVEQIKEGGMEAYFVDHTTGIWPQAASGMAAIDRGHHLRFDRGPCSRWYDCVRTTKPETRINTTFFVGQAFSGCVLIRTTFIRK